MNLIVASLSVLTFFITTPALASGPCREQVKEHCKDVKPGEGRIKKCIEEKSNLFSEDCKAHMASLQKPMANVKEECSSDADSLCAGKEKKELKQCLRQNRDKLSEDCKAALKDLKGEHRKSRRAKSSE